MDLAGAGGTWKTIDEKIDPSVIKQMSDISCGAACGEMLLLDRGVKISQIFIASFSGIPTEVASLAQSLIDAPTTNCKQYGGGFSLHRIVPRIIFAQVKKTQLDTIPR